MNTIYKTLHLEDIPLPKHCEKSTENNLCWEYNKIEPFSLIINRINGNWEYGLDLYIFKNKSIELDRLYNALSKNKRPCLGYTWEDYLLTFIKKNNIDLYKKIKTDSDSSVCGLYVKDVLEDYILLLTLVSQAIRKLFK